MWRVLELCEVAKHYRAGEDELIRAVDGVSLTVSSGELVALYGPSGSGKTTLLTLIAALAQPDVGRVLVNGRDVSRLSAAAAARYRRAELGFIRQSFDLLAGVSACDNAALKLFATHSRRQARQRVAPLLEMLGLSARSAQPAERLSTGERQRVMIARALSTDPALLLADEPTGSLDSQRGREVLELLRGLCCERGLATVLVTHDPRAAAFADRALTLSDGQLRAFEPEVAL